MITAMLYISYYHPKLLFHVIIPSFHPSVCKSASSLKGSWHESFDLFEYFYNCTSLKVVPSYDIPFWIFLRIRKENRQSWLHSECQWHRCCRISSWIIWHTFYAEIWLGCTRHSGVIDTAVTFTAVPMMLLCKYDTALTLDLILERYL
jgi:hypothetical protein